MPSSLSIVETDVEEGNLRVGRQIRDLRKSKGMTLSYVAEHIGKSVGYISQVERGVSALPISVLQAISDLLGVQITWFFHSDTKQDIYELDYVVRKNARRHLEFSGTGISEELLSPRLSGDILMIQTTLAPKAKSDQEPRKRKGGGEAGYIQSGSLELTIGSKKFTLEQGDSFSITGDEPHYVFNPSSNNDTVIIWILTPVKY
jgi:transcriptional regulator with XRE-family HTH domain